MQHSKPRPKSHYRVLPSGKFDGMIYVPLPTHCESFSTTVVIVFPYLAKLQCYKHHYKLTNIGEQKQYLTDYRLRQIIMDMLHLQLFLILRYINVLNNKNNNNNNRFEHFLFKLYCCTFFLVLF